MSDVALTWRQYRLERKMFWRNPSAAFFNFVLPLLFLALFGTIFASRACSSACAARRCRRPPTSAASPRMP